MMRRVAGLATLGLLVCSLTWAEGPLLPTVKVVERAGAARGGDCADVSTVAIPALQVEPARPLEMPRAAEAAGVSATSIGTLLREVQQATDRDDRDGFNDRLAEARVVASRLGPGPQKNAVADLLRVYGDLARVWDYSFASPTGAFFDNETQGGSLFSTLRAYPGYDEFIARGTVAGRYYPTRETRQFLTAVAASRLKSVGGVPASASLRTLASAHPSASMAGVSRSGSPRSLGRESQAMPVGKHSPGFERHSSRTPARESRATSRTSPALREKTAIAGRVVPKAALDQRAASGSLPPASSPFSSSVATTSTHQPSEMPDPLPANATTLPAETATTATTSVSDTSRAVPETTTSASAADTAAPDRADTLPAPPSQRRVVIPLLMTIVGIVLLVVLIRASR
jgi:hypothetical protein